VPRTKIRNLRISVLLESNWNIVQYHPPRHSELLEISSKSHPARYPRNSEGPKSHPPRHPKIKKSGAESQSTTRYFTHHSLCAPRVLIHCQQEIQSTVVAAQKARSRVCHSLRSVGGEEGTSRLIRIADPSPFEVCTHLMQRLPLGRNSKRTMVLMSSFVTSISVRPRLLADNLHYRSVKRMLPPPKTSALSGFGSA